eukprot:gnl/TRDRNA2_/TRDRNA2_67261_c0_seq2.p1 gnl/TRDRNA2_/TRDRNA2_67261_c0~~gnl/TRDRNA2_/TRDRNA2_67261_c0_seq2.p1  ORF type:complete len:463 (+),score=73.60 gnl/TRDRNA2_/TRDRNA2_67261_c0_seq2:69-1457(+)
MTRDLGYYASIAEGPRIKYVWAACSGLVSAVSVIAFYEIGGASWRQAQMAVQDTNLVAMHPTLSYDRMVQGGMTASRPQLFRGMQYGQRFQPYHHGDLELYGNQEAPLHGAVVAHGWRFTHDGRGHPKIDQQTVVGNTPVSVISSAQGEYSQEQLEFMQRSGKMPNTPAQTQQQPTSSQGQYSPEQLEFLRRSGKQPNAAPTGQSWGSSAGPLFAEPPEAAWDISGPTGPKVKGVVATPEQLAELKPTLYVYDHCPFCVRARMVFGLKNIAYNLVFLQNDDVVTPTKLVGKKITPILEDKARGTTMPESLDIVAYMDKDGMLKPQSKREDLKAWSKALGDVRSKLTRPRTGRSPLAEFGTRNAAQVWVNNHQIKDGTTYEEALAKTPEYIETVNKQLLDLESMIESTEYISPGGLSYDDIVYFPLLRSLTIAKGITYPPKVLQYMENMSRKADVPLFFQLAI